MAGREFPRMSSGSLPSKVSRWLADGFVLYGLSAIPESVELYTQVIADFSTQVEQWLLELSRPDNVLRLPKQRPPHDLGA